MIIDISNNIFAYNFLNKTVMVVDLKKITIITLTIIYLIFSSFCFADEIDNSIPAINLKVYNQKTNTNSTALKISAQYAILMDFESGRALYEKNARKRTPMASTTKIMTGIVAIENSSLDDEVAISKRAAMVGGSQIHLTSGQKFKMRDLLNGLLLNSGNDAAIAIAEHVGGSVDGFLNLMNEKAMELGAKDTHFKSPHGLDIEGHYSTAYDLALIARYALENKQFSNIVASRTAWFPTGILRNTNELLELYSGADGVKTGYTGLAGRCLVASATRNGVRLISVVLNAPTRTERAKSSKIVLDYGFTNFKRTQLATLGEKIVDMKIYRGKKDFVSAYTAENCVMPLSMNEISKMKKEFVPIGDIIRAPIISGEVVGNLKFTSNGKEIVKVPVIVNENVKKLEWIDYFTKVISSWSITEGRAYRY